MLLMILSHEMIHKNFFEHKLRENATCESFGPEHSSQYHLLPKRHCIQRSLSRY